MSSEYEADLKLHSVSQMLMVFKMRAMAPTASTPYFTWRFTNSYRTSLLRKATPYRQATNVRNLKHLLIVAVTQCACNWTNDKMSHRPTTVRYL
jgi:hypothetical protein